MRNEPFTLHKAKAPFKAPFSPSLSLSLSLSLSAFPLLSVPAVKPLPSEQHPSLKNGTLSFPFSLSFLFSGNCLFGLVSGWFSEATEVVFRWSCFNDCLIYLFIYYYFVFGISLSFSLSLSAHFGIRYYVLPPIGHNYHILVFKHTMFLQYFLMCTPPIIFLKYDNWYY